MRIHLPRRRIWRATIYLVSLLLVLIAFDLILVQERRNFTYGYDTTRVVGPVMPDGRIDYLSVIDGQYAEGVTPENNAAVPFLEAVGRSALALLSQRMALPTNSACRICRKREIILFDTKIS